MHPTLTLQSAMDLTAIRREFPILAREDHGRPLVYLDSAATSLKPRAVVQAITEFYETCPANVGRGIHRLSTEATDRFEEARDTIAASINAEAREIIFVRNATEAINVVATSLPPGATVVHSLLEHHSNFLPWQRHAANAIAADLLPDGQIDLDDLRRKIQQHRPQLVAVAHISNAWGVVNPISEIVAAAREVGARVLLDASQSAPHREIDIRDLDCDYLCFSGHKMCGPTGIGVLAVRGDAIQQLSPLHVGGGAVESVRHDQFQWRAAPYAFESGTPFIEGAIGLAAACNFLESIGMDVIQQHTSELVRSAIDQLSQVPGLQLTGPEDLSRRGGAVAWTMSGIDSHTVARILSDRYNICVRSGVHCAEPAHQAIQSPPTVRASFYLYNTPAEVEALANALHTIATQLR